MKKSVIIPILCILSMLCIIGSAQAIEQVQNITLQNINETRHQIVGAEMNTTTLLTLVVNAVDSDPSETAFKNVTVFAFLPNGTYLWSQNLSSLVRNAGSFTFNSSNYWVDKNTGGQQPPVHLVSFLHNGTRHNESMISMGSSVAPILSTTRCADYVYSVDYNHNYMLRTNYTANVTEELSNYTLPSTHAQALTSSSCADFWIIDDQAILHHRSLTMQNMTGGFNLTNWVNFTRVPSPTIQSNVSLAMNTTDLFVIASSGFVQRFYNLNIDRDGTIPTTPITGSNVSLNYLTQTLYTSVNFTVAYPNGTILFSNENGTYTITADGFYNWTSTSLINTSAGGNYAWNYTSVTGVTLTTKQKTFTVSNSPVVSIQTPDFLVTTSTIGLSATIADNDLQTCWYNITLRDNHASCLGSSCAIAFTCGTSPTIPDTGSFTTSNIYTLYVTANDTAGNRGYHTTNFTVAIPGATAQAAGGGGATIIISGNATSNMTFSPGIIIASFINPESTVEKTSLFTYEGPASTFTTQTSSSLKEYVTVEICDLELQECSITKELKNGERGVLKVNIHPDKNLGPGMVGKISMVSETDKFDMVVSIDRPLYGLIHGLSQLTCSLPNITSLIPQNVCLTEYKAAIALLAITIMVAFFIMFLVYF